MRGVVRTAFRLSFQEAAEARAAGNVEQETRAWKLFALVPRMLLTKPPRGGLVSKAKLSERCDAFARGEWLSLVEANRADAQSCSTVTSRRRRRGSSGDMMGRRAKRAVDAVGRTLECKASTGGCIGGSWQRENSNNVVGPVAPPFRAQSPRCTRAHRTQSRRPSGSGWRIIVTESPQGTPRGATGPSGLTGEHLRVILIQRPTALRSVSSLVSSPLEKSHWKS